MESSELLGYILIGTLIWALIMYFIVQNAVSSATNQLREYAKIQARALMYQLRKNGFSVDEIKKIYKDDNDEYWKTLEEINP